MKDLAVLAYVISWILWLFLVAHVMQKVSATMLTSKPLTLLDRGLTWLTFAPFWFIMCITKLPLELVIGTNIIIFILLLLFEILYFRAKELPKKSTPQP